MRHLIDLTGQQFGRLTVLEKSDKKTANGNTNWVCLCACGHKSIVDGYSLRTGQTQSCGCLRREMARKHKKSKEFLLYQGNKQSLMDENGVFWRSKNAGRRNQSGCVGVSYDARSNRYFARLRFKEHYVLLKSFATKEEAIQARKQAERYYFQNEDR